MFEITQELLRELIDYKPEMGVCIWKIRDKKYFKSTLRVSAWNAHYAGKQAGSIDSHGYYVTSIFDHRYSLHRIIWFYAHGAWPTHQIDHKNGNRSDNRLNNLRDVTNQVNQENIYKASTKSINGFRGVSRANNSDTYSARINIAGNPIYLGTYPNPEQAHQAYLEAKRKCHSGCAR